MLGGWEMALIAAIGLLIFGKKLPEVARNMGKGVVEFKKGLSGIEDEIETAGATPGIDRTLESKRLPDPHEQPSA